MTKRHYNKGYHISTNLRKHFVSPLKEENLTQIEENKTISTVDYEIENSRSVKNNSDDFQSEVMVVESKGNNEAFPSFKNHSLMKTSKEVVKNLQLPVEKIKNRIEDKKIKNTPVRDGEGLSLLWIVIIVLLILWALGVISGNFGGIVHLLLLVALILLILWLIRVI